MAVVTVTWADPDLQGAWKRALEIGRASDDVYLALSLVALQRRHPDVTDTRAWLNLPPDSQS